MPLTTGPSDGHHPGGRLGALNSRVRAWPAPVRKVAVLLVGGVLLLAGIAMLVLPGPGLVVCAAGLAVLAVEFPWARRVLATGKRAATAVWAKVRPKR